MASRSDQSSNPRGEATLQQVGVGPSQSSTMGHFSRSTAATAARWSDSTNTTNIHPLDTTISIRSPSKRRRCVGGGGVKIFPTKKKKRGWTRMQPFDPISCGSLLLLLLFLSFGASSPSWSVLAFQGLGRQRPTPPQPQQPFMGRHKRFFLEGSEGTILGQRSSKKRAASHEWRLFLSEQVDDTNPNQDDTTETSNSNNLDSIQVDVCICGGGPAGLLLASQLAQQQPSPNSDGNNSPPLSIAIVDPALTDVTSWPNNYGIWMDEADWFQYDDCVDRVWKTARVVFDETSPQLSLDRPYGRVDRVALKRRLLQECRHRKPCRNKSKDTKDQDVLSQHENGHNGIWFLNGKATQVQHMDDNTTPSQVTVSLPQKSLEQPNGDDTTTTTMSTQRLTVHAPLVVDATGFGRVFCDHAVPFDPGYQVTYGARYRVPHLGPQYTVDEMVLMDYSQGHLHHNATLVASNERFPSFVYVMPLSDTEIFLEETILVSRPGGSSRNLQARLEHRMHALGIPQPWHVLEDERAAIPMGGADPRIPQRTVGFGATSSLVHPASGYMMARAIEVAPRVAHAVAPLLFQWRRQQEQAQEPLQDDGMSPVSLDQLSTVAWEAVWPADERRQRDFMNFGFELLCLLNPQELRDFFTGFFRLPAGLWQHFLSWRLSGIGHVIMGLLVWATCIPKRFMGPMLWKSLPFVLTKLILPFVWERPRPIYTDSWYWDAQTGNSTLWEPDSFFPYVQHLSSSLASSSSSNTTTTAAARPTTAEPTLQEAANRP